MLNRIKSFFSSDQSITYESELIDLIKQGNISELELLIDTRSINPTLLTKQGLTLMSYAAYFDKPQVINFLHSIGCEVTQTSKTGESPLLRACYYKRYSSIEELLRLGADINAKQNEYPLVQALYRQNEELTKFLLERGADPGVMFLDEHREQLEKLPEKVVKLLLGYRAFKRRVPMLYVYKYGNTVLNAIPGPLLKEVVMFIG